MGHGGTLDPMATGVLIVGIGRGTKYLQDFLYCTKTYETVVLFGKSTDTYDVAGKVVDSGETAHLGPKLVEHQLAAFTGPIKQVPPIYSALKIDGVKAYDYARSGKELPRELQAREMNVSECVLTDWYEAGEHKYKWPTSEVSEEEKKVYSKLDAKTQATGTQVQSSQNARTEREVGSSSMLQAQETYKPQERVKESRPMLTKEQKAALHTHEMTGLSEKVADVPAARIRLTVSSGFYVRSFAHDLGRACGSYGTMAELARIRQAQYTSADPAPDGLLSALDHADINKGEEIWGPKITRLLEAWLAENPAPTITPSGPQHKNGKSLFRHPRDQKRGDRRDGNHKRRNSSSPEA